MPLLGFREQWFHPHLALADGFLVRLRAVVAPDLLEVFRIERAVDAAPPVAGRALGLDRAAIARRGVCPIDGDVFGRLDPLAEQHMVLWAAVFVALRVVGES